ncbi:MAG: TolC family protein [Roseovarius sp.]
MKQGIRDRSTMWISWYRPWLTYVILLLPLLGGCALLQPTDPLVPVAHDTERFTQVDPAYAAAAAAEVAIDQPLRLQDCIALALAHNPSIRQGYWHTEEASAQRDRAASQRWPEMTIEGGYREFLDDQRLVGVRAPGEPGVWSSSQYSADVVVSIPLFMGGRIINNMRASELRTRAAEHQLARTREELVFNVSSLFYAILGQRQVIESLVFAQTTLQEHRQRVQALLDAGKAARVDLLRTEVRLADLEQKLVEQRNVRTIQRQTLLNLLGVESTPDSLPEVEGELSLQPFDLPADSLALAQTQRSDYQAAQAECAAQAHAVDAMRGEHAPVLALAGSYGRRWAGGNTLTQEGARNDEDVGSIGLTLSIPLFEGGRIRADVRGAQARLAAAQERLRELELRIRLDVQNAIANLQSSRARIRATEVSIAQARESLRIEREKHAIGQGSITDVLDAQTALLEAETSHAQTLAAYNQAVVQYRLAVGE